MNLYELFDPLNEKWSQKYKRSIDCSNPKGFSQRAHCQGRKKHNEDASGVIAKKGQEHDPRYSMSLTKDVRPGEVTRQLKKFNLAEDGDPHTYKVLHKLIAYAAKKLKIRKLPGIDITDEIRSSGQPTFGTFDPETNTISVAIANRHVMDSCRTMAHELVHHRQRELGMLKPGDGDTGSDMENQANSVAGIIMRKFAELNPDLFSDINEIKDVPKTWDDYGQHFDPKVQPTEKVYHSWDHYNKEEHPEKDNEKDAGVGTKLRLPIR